MRFMLLFKPVTDPEPGTQACRQNLPEMATLIAELKRSGVLLMTEGLMSSESGARVRIADGRTTITDGPFAEAKELVAGVCMVEVPDRRAAVALAERFLTIAGGGEGDILQIADPPDRH